MPHPKSVAVHPLVLLSIVDHYNRVVGKAPNKRVVGVILGLKSGDKLDITNCYAIPFDEDPNEKNVWFLDTNYHETMFEMFKKIHSKEKVFGWYTTGNKFKTHDIEINEIFKKYTPDPLMVMIDVKHLDSLALPTAAYGSVDEIDENGNISKKFVHIQSSVEAFEAEEVGVEHLLREIKDISLNSLGNDVQQKVLSLRGLITKISIIKKYLTDVMIGAKPANQKILANLQEMVYLMPNLNSEEFKEAYTIKNNDLSFSIYMGNTVRSILSLHDLINNKLRMKETEKLNDKSEEKKAVAVEEVKEKSKV